MAVVHEHLTKAEARELRQRRGKSSADIAGEQSVRRADQARDDTLAELRQEVQSNQQPAANPATTSAIGPPSNGVPRGVAPPADDGLSRGEVLSPAKWAQKFFPDLAKFPVLPGKLIAKLDGGYDRYLNQIDREHKGRLDTSEARRRLARDDAIEVFRQQQLEAGSARDAATADNRGVVNKLAQSRVSATAARDAATMTNRTDVNALSQKRIDETFRNNDRIDARSGSGSGVDALRQDAIDEITAGRGDRSALQRFQDAKEGLSLPKGQSRDRFEEALLGRNTLSEAGDIVQIGDGIIKLAASGPAGWLKAALAARRMTQVGLTGRQQKSLSDILTQSAPTYDEVAAALSDGSLTREEFEELMPFVDPTGRQRALSPPQEKPEGGVGSFFMNLLRGRDVR